MVHKDEYEAFYAAHPGICKTVIQKVYSWKVSQDPDNNFYGIVENTSYSTVSVGCSPSIAPNGNGGGRGPPTVSSQSSPVVRVSNMVSPSTPFAGGPLVKTRIPQRVGQPPVAVAPSREQMRLTRRQYNF